MSTFVYFQTGCQKTGNSHITMMKTGSVIYFFLEKGGLIVYLAALKKGAIRELLKY